MSQCESVQISRWLHSWWELPLIRGVEVRGWLRKHAAVLMWQHLNEPPKSNIIRKLTKKMQVNVEGAVHAHGCGCYKEQEASQRRIWGLLFVDFWWHHMRPPFSTKWTSSPSQEFFEANLSTYPGAGTWLAPVKVAANNCRASSSHSPSETMKRAWRKEM